MAKPRRRTGFKTILRMCDGVICGNAFIAEYARQWSANVCLLHTAVVTSRFVPSSSLLQRRRIVGWSGLAVGLKYLYKIEKALLKVLNTHKDVVLWVVSEQPPRFRHLPTTRVEYVPWSTINEVRAVQK